MKKIKNSKVAIKKNLLRNKELEQHQPREITPEEALRFLEDIRTMQNDIDEPTISISLRVPGNILRALKMRAKAGGKKYQSLIIEYLRYGLRHKHY